MNREQMIAWLTIEGWVWAGGEFYHRASNTVMYESGNKHQLRTKGLYFNGEWDTDWGDVSDDLLRNALVHLTGEHHE